MIRLPSVVSIGEDLFLNGLETLEPVDFKVLMFLIYRAQFYEEIGACYDSSLLADLERELALNYDQLVSGFIEARRRNLLDGLLIFQDVGRYGEHISRIEFRWYTTLCYDDESEEEYEPQNWFETELTPRDTKADIPLVLGTEIVSEPIDITSSKQHPRGKHWKKVREQALVRDGHKCTECGTGEKLHVHHLTYQNEGAELLKELVTLCRSCHAKKPKLIEG